MGLLDSKSRIIDTAITFEGRRQLSHGGLDIKYVTFTDAASYYAADVVSGSQDATSRLYLEACQLPQDDVTFQSEYDGSVQPFRNSDGVQVTNGRILQYSFNSVNSQTITGSLQGVTTLTGSSFMETADKVLASSSDNFKKLMIIASNDKVFDDSQFAFGPDDVTFVITNDRPISNPEHHFNHVNSLDSVFSDPRFSNSMNFQYLPPVNKRQSSSDGKGFTLGSYKPWGRTSGLSYEQLMSELKTYELKGFMKVINFDPTSGDNRLLGQFFEKNNDTLKKLDIVNFGTFRTGNPTSPLSQVFFAGKLIIDDNGTDTFVHLFTLVFE